MSHWLWVTPDICDVVAAVETAVQFRGTSYACQEACIVSIGCNVSSGRATTASQPVEESWLFLVPGTDNPTVSESGWMDVSHCLNHDLHRKEICQMLLKTNSPGGWCAYNSYSAISVSKLWLGMFLCYRYPGYHKLSSFLHYSQLINSGLVSRETR